MTELNLDIFKPWETKLSILVDKYNDLTIKDLDDEDGYHEVCEAIKDCTKHRTSVNADGKGLRAETNAFSKKVIAREKELLAITAETEEHLRGEKLKIDDERTIRQREILLPSRQKELKEIGIEIEDKELLLMSPDEYREFRDEKKLAYFESKEAKENEEQEKIDKVKEVEEIKKETKDEIRLQRKEDVNKVEQLVDDFLIEWNKYKVQNNLANCKVVKISFINKLKKLING